MSKLYLGVKKIDITPAVGVPLAGYVENLPSTKIHDTLDATAFVFQQGEEKAMLISATVCVIRKELAATIREQIAAETGIPYENIIIAPTHTHSGPVTDTTKEGVEYCEAVFIPKMVEVAKQAAAELQPVTMGYAFGDSLVGINRRENYKKNGLTLGQCPWGPFDPRMLVITFKNADDQIVASMIHYGCHGTAAGLTKEGINQEISQDWPGIMVRRIETLTGATAAFFNGAEGDVGPRISNGKTMGDISYVEELGGVAAQDATRILKTVTKHTDCDLKCVNSTTAIPMKKRISLEEAQEKLEECKKGRLIYAAELSAKRYYEDIIKSYEAGEPEQEAHIDEQILLRIGNLVFVGFCYELFSEISMRIQKESKDLIVLPLSNANGYISYFPTQSELCRGGYEINMFQTMGVQQYVDNADYCMICETLKNIEKVK